MDQQHHLQNSLHQHKPRFGFSAGEYLIFGLTQFISSMALTTVLILLAHGLTDFSYTAVPTCILMLTAPLCSLLFIRIRSHSQHYATAFNFTVRHVVNYLLLSTHFLVILGAAATALVTGLGALTNYYGSPMTDTITGALAFVVMSSISFAYFWKESRGA